ncbi:hypothetical protein GW7_14175 [Heterocephalus glaber]|uniref:Uncharacterized protein n=1 Tax=Heterocephalus glaber TaxID=10181 RepID=G5BW60_HETGA|nr:hypothetical protein GW7_14175 [Heterocephalus glaber]
MGASTEVGPDSGELRAPGNVEGVPLGLRLMLAMLWASEVGLELASVLVLGPGLPPLGPLAWAATRGCPALGSQPAGCDAGGPVLGTLQPGPEPGAIA